ncbi:MAG: endonuclease/exonuclease/phosphatase family protein [Verrucomicrobiota bacterium]
MAQGDVFEIDALTFNIRFDNPMDGRNAWPNRKDMVGSWLMREAPDIIGLQEALRHQIDDIRGALPGYEEFGVGRDDGKDGGEHCSILYRQDRFEIDEVDRGTFWLSDTPEIVASKSWGNKITRICSWARFVEKKSKRGIYVYNTHWDHRSQPSREEAAKLVVERVAARKRKEDPVILMGDFNAAEENRAITTLTKSELKFIDTYRVVNPDNKAVRTAHGFKGEKEGRKIDHIFILPATAEVKLAEIIRYEENGRFLSDHYPVRAALRFGRVILP